MSRLRSAIKAIDFISPRMKKCTVVACKKDSPEEVCMLNSSPYYIFKLAARGNVLLFENYFKQNPKSLQIKNQKCQNVLHIAAEKGHEDVLLFALANGAHIDAEDNKGSTPLHIAVMNRHPECVNILLKYGCNPHIHNLQQNCAIHLACELDYDDILLVLLKYKSIDIYTLNRFGATPLHCTAAKDSYKCAKVLLDHGSQLCQTCEIGFYPIHTACITGSTKTMKVFFDFVKSRGQDVSTLLSCTDKDNNMPLHSAVRGGFVEAVQLCLDEGSRIDVRQDDKYNPLHMASAQGNFDMVKLMYELHEESFMKALQQKDILQMTPLHRATLFNHGNIIEFLISKGADIETGDTYMRTPFLLAASKGLHDAAGQLVKAGANVFAKDINFRNVLHLAIKGGAMASRIFRKHAQDDESREIIKQLTDEKDVFGCTALHYASQEGRLMALSDLIVSGATINSKNNAKESPFHFAARYGRYKSCCKLLDSLQGNNILNETDAKGMSAMHIAAEHGHVKILDLLITRGAVVSKDYRNNTPLHHAAANGFTQSITLLLNVHCYLMNATNSSGETALHLAAKNGHTAAVTLLLFCKAHIIRDRKKMTFFDHILETKNFEVAQAVIIHERWEEILSQKSEIYGEPILGLIKELPEACLILMDRCTIPSKDDPKSKKFYIDFNFRYVQNTNMTESGEIERRPVCVLGEMVKYGRAECLRHPLTINYLTMKWLKYGLPLSLGSFFLYILFVTSLTAFALTTKDFNCTSSNSDNEYPFKIHLIYITGYIAVIYSFIHILSEVLKVFKTPLIVQLARTELLGFILHITSLTFIVPRLDTCKMEDYQTEVGILAIFLAWFNILLYLQSYEFTGIYVVMFLEISLTLIKVFAIFSSLIMAFGFAFYLSMKPGILASYDSPFLWLLKSLMMMLELDYSSTFKQGSLQEITNYSMPYLILLFYVILMPFLLMNLLIGLAVGDIESIQKNASLKRLTMQVANLGSIERIIPVRFLRRFHKDIYKVYPNEDGKYGSTVLSQHLLKNKFDSNEMHAAKIEWEMRKQNQRLKSVLSMMDKQQELIQMITQKMDICAENDFDEGDEITECMGTALKKTESIVKRNKSFIEKTSSI